MGIPRIGIEAFLAERNDSQVIDVRSPGEFNSGHMPGAVNLPLFDDAEREIVGTTYKKKGRKEAILEGLKLVGVKLADLAGKGLESAKNNSLLVYCWRGGMRSENVAWLMDLLGIETRVLEGGYKAYRNFVLDSFAGISDVILLGGETGSGKTDILLDLQGQGEQVVDLEGLAHHKGSAFGGMGQQPQPTTQQFENNLADALMKYDLSKRIWFEDESTCIGRVAIPFSLREKMAKSAIIRISVPKNIRIKRILAEYGSFSKEGLKENVNRISGRLGGKSTKEALEYLDNDDISQTVELLLHYYDKAYDHPFKKRNIEKIHLLKINDPVKASGKVLELANKL